MAAETRKVTYHVPARLLDKLRIRASQQGRSMNSEIIRILDKALRHTTEESE